MIPDSLYFFQEHNVGNQELFQASFLLGLRKGPKGIFGRCLAYDNTVSLIVPADYDARTESYRSSNLCGIRGTLLS